MNDVVETHDCSKQQQRQTPQNIGPRPALSEILRPQRLSDLTLPTPMIECLQKMVETKSVMDMLFYGKAGTGKTSAACLFEDHADVGVFGVRMFAHWDGSSVKNVDFVRTDMKNGLSSEGYKILVLDRADLVPEAAQQALPSVIDEMYHCRFLFTVNHRSKIIPEIRSRLVPICFDIEPSDRVEVQKRLIDRYESKLAECGIAHDKGRLIEIIGTNYPDLRLLRRLNSSSPRGIRFLILVCSL
jgi:replication-associated recombination protein RarA